MPLGGGLASLVKAASSPTANLIAESDGKNGPTADEYMSSKQHLSPRIKLGAWSAAAKLATNALNSSPHAESINAVEDPTLRAALLTLVTTQQTAAKAREEANVGNAAALDEMNDTFKTSPDERLLARVVLNRANRTNTKGHDAHTRLDAELDSFLKSMLDSTLSLQQKRLDDQSAAKVRFEQKEAQRTHEVAQLEARRKQSVRAGCSKAGRLAMILGAAEKRGAAETAMLMQLLRESLAEADEEQAAAVHKHEIELLAAVRAPTPLIENEMETCLSLSLFPSLFMPFDTPAWLLRVPLSLHSARSCGRRYT